jgi:hypothetical protein
VLVPAAAGDPVFQARAGPFLQGLAVLGWSVGRNVRVDARWTITDAAEIRRHAATAGCDGVLLKLVAKAKLGNDFSCEHGLTGGSGEHEGA